MRFLRVLGLGLVELAVLGQRMRAVALRDDLAQFDDRIDREVGGIGAHVGDEADLALVGAQRHAFVQPLRQAHGAVGREAELARGLLLQRGGDEGRGRAPLALLARDLRDQQRAVGGFRDRAARGFGAGAVAEAELLDLVAVVAREARLEGLLRMGAVGGQGPVLLRLEGLDLLLAHHDHAQRRRLHAPGRQAGADLAPQHRREVEADQVIERAARLLRVDQRRGDPARVLHRLADGARRDLGEDHAVQGAPFEQAALLEDLGDVPADGFAFAIGVGREVERVGGLGRARDRLDVLLVLLDQLVAHGELALRIDRALLGHQVAHMAVRGQDMEVLAEVLVDRLRLGRRFDDEEVLGHGFRGSAAGLAAVRRRRTDNVKSASRAHAYARARGCARTRARTTH